MIQPRLSKVPGFDSFDYLPLRRGDLYGLRLEPLLPGQSADSCLVARDHVAHWLQWYSCMCKCKFWSRLAVPHRCNRYQCASVVAAEGGSHGKPGKEIREIFARTSPALVLLHASTCRVQPQQIDNPSLPPLQRRLPSPFAAHYRSISITKEYSDAGQLFGTSNVPAGFAVHLPIVYMSYHVRQHRTCRQ